MYVVMTCIDRYASELKWLNLVSPLLLWVFECYFFNRPLHCNVCRYDVSFTRIIGGRPTSGSLFTQFTCFDIGMACCIVRSDNHQELRGSIYSYALDWKKPCKLIGDAFKDFCFSKEDEDEKGKTKMKNVANL